MRSLSIRSKLLAMMLLAGLCCLAAAGLVADYYGTDALQAAIFHQLTILRENKRVQMTDYVESQQRAVRLLSEAPDTEESLAAFSMAFRQLNSGPAEPVSETLLRHYQDDYLPILARASSGVPLLESYVPAGRAARILQTAYIAKDRAGAAQGDKPGGPSLTAYEQVYRQYDPFLTAAVREIGFEDLLLIDAETGNVVYSVEKQEDFATNLRQGPYARSGLARAFEHALELHDVGAVWYEAFSAYAPAELAPAGFFAAPVTQADGTIIGVVAAKISTAEMDRVMTSGHHWEDVGLGGTGSAYLVGSDGRARSDDRLMIEDKPAFLRLLAKVGVDATTIARIDQFNTTTLYLPIDTAASRAALRGESGTGVIRDYTNIMVLSSWAPLDFGGNHWAVIAEMDVDEAFKPQRQFRQALLIVAAVSAVLLTLLSLVWANTFARPIREILAHIKKLAEGDDTARIPLRGHDEFNELAQGFNAMAEEMALRNVRIQETRAEYEGLLKNVYPEIVAERVKAGQTSIAEVVRNVSMLVLNIDGVNVLFQSKDHDTASVMKEIIDAFDEAADRLGIEKLKTMGESYFAASGLTAPRLDHATRAVTFAAEACHVLDRLGRRLHLPLELRVGIASGDVEAGLIGRQRTVYDVWGTTMTTARRIVFEAGSNAIRVTSVTYSLLNNTDGFDEKPPITTRTLGNIVTYELLPLAPACPPVEA